MPRYQSIKNIPLNERHFNLPEAIEIESGDDVIVKSLRNKISQYNILQEFQAGGTVDQDRQWLENWYTNRQIPDTRVQRLYEEDRDAFTTLSQFLPDPRIVDNISANISGQYDPTTEEITMTPNASRNTYLHEATHRTQDFNSAMRPLHQQLVDKNIKPQEQLLPQYRNDYNYYKDPDEIHARIQVLRREAGIKPDQLVTPEYLQNYLKNYQVGETNIDDLLNLTDEKGLLQLLNYTADNSTPSNLFYAQKGGIIEDDMGQYNHPGNITKINSGRITMNNILYPVLGVDNLGNSIIMQPNQEYKFPGTSVIEFPLNKK